MGEKLVLQLCMSAWLKSLRPSASAEVASEIGSRMGLFMSLDFNRMPGLLQMPWNPRRAQQWAFLCYEASFAGQVLHVSNLMLGVVWFISDGVSWFRLAFQKLPANLVGLS